jgi:hypothetical protein
MSFHGIVAKRVIGSVINKGKSVTLSAATETEAWRRTEEMADQVGETLKSVVEKKPENIPNGAKELILRFADYLVAVHRAQVLTFKQ